MIQIIDVSQSILYNQERDHTDMLKIINATVSHELRNPLNSLIAQNIEKQYLYENMKKIIETIPDCNQKDKLNEIIAQLKYGSKV